MGELPVGDGETDVDASPTERSAGVTVETGPEGRPRLVVPSDAPFGPADVDVRRAGGDASREGVLAGAAWLLLAPAAVALLASLLLVGGLVGTRPIAGGPPAVVVLALVTVLVAGTADLWLYEDAAHLAAVDAAWQPNPWTYYVGGGLVLTLGLVAWTGVTTLLGTPRAVAGVVVAGLVLSSVVAGPVYYVRRYRTVGLP